MFWKRKYISVFRISLDIDMLVNDPNKENDHPQHLVDLMGLMVLTDRPR